MTFIKVGLPEMATEISPSNMPDSHLICTSINTYLSLLVVAKV